MSEAIRGFRGEHRWLSNFWPCRVPGRTLVYPTVEHAYQAAKTLDAGERAAIARLATPGQAKAAGRRLTLRPDWDRVKERAMLLALRAKFADPGLAARLLATGDAELVEDNSWGDRYWGVCNGTGQNRLGRLLMQVRDELRAADSA